MNYSSPLTYTYMWPFLPLLLPHRRLKDGEEQESLMQERRRINCLMVCQALKLTKMKLGKG
jgi:hypothetical protein